MTTAEMLGILGSTIIVGGIAMILLCAAIRRVDEVLGICLITGAGFVASLVLAQLIGLMIPIDVAVFVRWGSTLGLIAALLLIPGRNLLSFFMTGAID